MFTNKSCGWRALRIVVGLIILVLLIAGGAEATKFINNNATGGDCTSIGTWNSSIKTCILTTDLTDTVQIDSNGVTLNGNGHTITGSNTGYGVYISGKTGVNIKNLNIEQFYNGIYLWSSSNNTLIRNNASNNDNIGIYLAYSSNNTLNRNNASNNKYGIGLDISSNNTLSSNNANSNSDCAEYGCFGIGIYSASSSNNTLIRNNASNNDRGIVLFYSYNNIIIGNNASNNNYIGFHLDYSSNNSVYNNVFNNIDNFGSYYSINRWNTTKTTGMNIIGGSYLGGNFWGNPNSTGFSQTCADTDKDGICDSKYSLDSNNIDYLPLAREAGGKATLTVDDSGGADYSKIQDAIDNSSAGDTIIVYSGTYYENVFVTKSLILKGIDNGGGKPFVDAHAVGSAMTLSVGNTTLEGFITKNGLENNGQKNSGIFVNSNDNLIRNNDASRNEYGIYLFLSSNNTLSGNNASNNIDGIFLEGSFNNRLSKNNVSYNAYGILLVNSNNNTLSSNNASNTNNGIILGGSNNNKVADNIASNNVYGISLEDSNNNALSGNIFLNNIYDGISLVGSDNNKLADNIASNNDMGISLLSSENNKLAGNNASNNDRGISLDDSNDNMLSGNNASKNLQSIKLMSSSNNTLNRNNALNNDIGITLYYSNNNTIRGNNASNNYCGFNLVASPSNNIYDNYIGNNTINAYDDNNNIWNTTQTQGTNIIGGSHLGGNYWSDYAGTDLNGDGLGDTLIPYNSSGNIENGGDFLPLVHVISPGPGALNITSFSPTTSIVTNNVGESKSFSITTNQIVNVSWFINGTEVFNETGVLTSSYTDSSAALGMWNVFALVKNANGSAMQTWIWIVTPIPVGSIMNSGFENGTASWTFYTNGTGTFSIISPGYEGIKAARVALKTNGTNIQLYQKGIILEPNTRYRLSFAAYSTSGHDLGVNLIKHGSPYTNYGLAYKANLSKSWQTFTTEFTSSGFKGTVNDGRLMFWMTPFAASGDTYYIDNVQLEKV